MRAFHLVGHRLAEVVQERRPLRRLHGRLELGRHDPRQLDDLERVLEDVLAVARAEAQPAEDLHQLLVQLTAVGLEDGLLARLADVRPRAPPSRGSTSPRSASGGCARPRSASRSVSRAISRRSPSNDERTTAFGVSSMMKSTPVRCSSARMLRPSRPMIRPFMSSDGQLDERDRGLGGRGSRPPAAGRRRPGSGPAASPRSRASSSSCRTRPCELVADLLLGLLEQLGAAPRPSSCPRCARARGGARPSPASAPPGAARRWVSRSAMPCSRRDELGELAVDVVLLARAPAPRSSITASRRCRSSVSSSDAQPHGLLARVDCGLAPGRLGVAARLLQEQRAGAAGFGEPGAGENAQDEQRAGDTGGKGDHDCRRLRAWALLGLRPARIQSPIGVSGGRNDCALCSQVTIAAGALSPRAGRAIDDGRTGSRCMNGPIRFQLCAGSFGNGMESELYASS